MKSRRGKCRNNGSQNKSGSSGGYTGSLSVPLHGSLVGGFNPFEKYLSKWVISPGRGENKKYLKLNHLDFF